MGLLANAIVPGAPQVWDEAPGNVCFDWHIGDPATTDTPFRSPPHSPDPFLFDAAFLASLADSADQTAAACWDLLAMVRESRATSFASGIPVSGFPAAEAA